jgi:hypothetical protein
MAPLGIVKTVAHITTAHTERNPMASFRNLVPPHFFSGSFVANRDPLLSLIPMFARLLLRPCQQRMLDAFLAGRITE